MLREAGNIGSGGTKASAAGTVERAYPGAFGTDGVGARGPGMSLSLAAPVPLLRLPRRTPARALAMVSSLSRWGGPRALAPASELSHRSTPRALALTSGLSHWSALRALTLASTLPQ